MKIFLAIAAILAWIFGLGQLLAPAKFYAPMGVEFTPMLATIAQTLGANLFGLGVINWCARQAQGRGLTAVLLGNKIAAPGVVIHVVLGAFFLFFLLRARKQESAQVSAAARP
ncbi:MAG: hypothetical protein DMG96_20010 [Acidobacteria bacterium]|nr:MAG: hypothetical protein DMG96_20010 [Acidobacteriota bacterium]